MKLKLRSLLFLSFVLLMSTSQNHSFAQARLVFGPTATYVRMNGGTSGTPIYLVIGDAASNAAPNTITWSAGQGGLISEGEFNYLKWYTGSGTGTNYTIPWRDETTPSTEDQSVKFDIGTAGSAGGFFLASTYDGVTDNLTYKPTPVGNMQSGATANASQWVVDRFWSLIDVASYGTKPALNNLKFAYVANEWNLNTGTITETNLRAQRWNTTLSAWQGLLFGGAPAANVQTTAALPAADLFRWWTLVDNSKPLPVEFLDLSAECNRGNVTVKWSTATEQNSDYFTVERSLDGTSFTAIATVQAAGNSSTVKNYSAVDYDSYVGTSFYRVKETDFNGSYMYSSTITVSGCSNDDIAIYGTGGGASVNINAIEDGSYNIEMFDMLGQKIIGQIADVTAGNNHIKISTGNIASAIYVVKVYNSNNSIAKKVFIRSDYK